MASLAERVAMSRSAFSLLFAETMGRPPLQYLREQRMRTASRLLRNPRLGVKTIASRVGYHSAASFSAAFKRWSGRAPGAYRRGMRTYRDS